MSKPLDNEDNYADLLEDRLKNAASNATEELKKLTLEEKRAVIAETPRVINDIGDLAMVGVLSWLLLDTEDVFFRGHGDADWKLRPLLYREGHDHKWETNTNARFVQEAPSRYTQCPAPEDLSSWLLLMQHYRLPTRLLDWSGSPLVAAFFAVNDKESANKDGVLWAMHPVRLNEKELNRPKILTSSGKTMLDLTRPAFHFDDSGSNDVAAVFPRQVDIRLFTQQARCTIHGDDVPLQDRGLDDCLLDFIIPAKKKKILSYSLRSMKVTRSTLFPDLENLASDLRTGTYN